MTSTSAHIGVGLILNSVEFSTLRRQAAAADSAGFDFVSVGDNPQHMRDTYVALSQLATATTRTSIGSTITTPHHRDPLVVATGFSSIAELAPGRTFIGIGTGRARPAARMDELLEHVITLRDLWNTGHAKYRGFDLALSWDAAPVPIVVCAAGPRGLRIGGQHADAVIVEAGLGAEQVAQARQWVSEGAREAGRDPDSIQMWWYARTSIGTSPDEAMDDALTSLAAAGAFLARANPDLPGVPEAMKSGLRTLGERYDMASHVRTDHDNPNRLLLDDERIRDFLVERTGIVGDPAQWRARLTELADLGVQNLLCVGAGGDKDQFIDLVGRHVLTDRSGPSRRIERRSDSRVPAGDAGNWQMPLVG